jgi:hypothetical protein
MGDAQPVDYDLRVHEHPIGFVFVAHGIQSFPRVLGTNEIRRDRQTESSAKLSLGYLQRCPSPSRNRKNRPHLSLGRISPFRR